MLRIVSAILVCGATFAQAPEPETSVKRTPPRVIRQASPEYSEEARLAGVSGKVVARVVVGVDGSVKSVQTACGVGFGLDEMAEKAVRQWQFQPGEKDGIPVSAPTTVDVNFGLPAERANFGPASLMFPRSPASTRPVLVKVPERLSDSGLQDQPVVLEIEVDAQGNCKIVAVLSGSAPDAEAVSKNVEQWRFRPAVLDGSPVVTRGRLTFLMGKPEEQRGAPPNIPQVETDALRVSSSVSRPRVLRQVQPQYSEEARKAGVSGTVLTKVVVGADGTVANVRTFHGIGFGLDEKAEEAVRQWQFQPGEKEGVPVAVMANIEVNFHLLTKRPDFGPNALIFALNPEVTRPELLSLPEKLHDTGADADPVVLDLEVDTDGKCKVIGVVRGAPEDADAVSKNVEKWRFRPAELNGNLVAVQGQTRYLLGKSDKSYIEAPAVPIH